MDLEGITLSKMNQTKNGKYYSFTYMWNLNKTNTRTQQKQTHRQNKLIVARGEGDEQMNEKV